MAPRKVCMRLLNKYPAVGRSVGAKVPAKTLNYYPLMSKLAAPETVRRIETPQGPETVVDMNPSQPPETAYKAPTKFTGNIDSDINNEMARLRAEDAQRVQKLQQQLPEMRKLEENKHLATDHVFKGIYDSPDGDAFLRRRATQNVFDANQNMDYDDLSGNIAEQYNSSNGNQGNQTKGTQALADKMKFHQDTGPEQFGWTSPSTWGVPRFTRNLLNPSEWSTRDFAAADTALNAAQFGAAFVNPALAPLLAASKGVGTIYGKARNNMYDSRNGFQWGELGMDALRGGVNTALSSIGAGNNTGALGNVFRPLDQVTSRVGKYVTDKMVGAPINLASTGYDWVRRRINPFYGELRPGVMRPLGRFLSPNPSYDPSNFYANNFLPGWDRVKAGVGAVGSKLNNSLVAPVINKVVPNIKNLKGLALSGAEQYLTQGAAQQAENFLASTGAKQIRDYVLPRYNQEQARNSTGALPANQQFAQNMPRPANPQFAQNMPRPVNQPQFNGPRG